MTIESDFPSDARPARILVADDSFEQRRALARLLAEEGYQVDEADSGEAVFLFLNRTPPDLLILDLQMPGTDGFDVLAHLQKSHAELPVILLSALPPAEIERSMKRLPQRSLPPLVFKPIDPDHFLEVVSMHLRGELPA